MFPNLSSPALHATTLGLSLLALGGATSYQEDFESGANGWFSFDAAGDGTIVSTGGVDGGAFLKGERVVFFPIHSPTGSPAKDACTGDLVEKYGTRIEIAYFGRSIATDGIAGPPHHWIFSDDGSIARWMRPVPEGVGAWAEIRFVIDADWTDAEAEANGWERFSTDAGVKSWSETIRSVTSQTFYTGDCPAPCTSSMTHETGIDRVSIRPVTDCVADLDVSGGVDGGDLTTLLAAWGPCTGCPADLDGSGAVDGADLAVLLSAWGTCE